MARAEMDSTIEKGIMGVGEGSVCASVQNIGAGMTHKLSWTLYEQLVQSWSLLFYFLSFSHLIF